MTEPPVVIQRILPYPPQHVFDRFVGSIGQWWVPRTAPWGSAAVLSLESGRDGAVREDDQVVGRIDVWQPGEALQFTLHGSTVTVTFAAHSRGTRLTLTHTGWSPWADPGVLDVRSFEDVVRAWWLDAALRL